MSVSAAATVERRSFNLLPWLDLVVVPLAAVVALALGAPTLGVVVGAVAWIIARLTSVVVERKLEDVDDLRRRLALAVTYKMARVWVLAMAIIAVGVLGSREDGLAAALVIFGAFSLYFAGSAIAHVTKEKTT